MKLIRKLVPRPAHSRSVRASALNHEVRNYAVKNQPVIERPLLFFPGLFVGELLRSFGQPDEILHRLRRFLVEQLDDNISERSLKNRVCARGTAHALSPCNFASILPDQSHAR